MLKSIFISFLALMFASLCLGRESTKSVSLDIYDAQDYQELESSQGWLKGVQSFRLDRKLGSDHPYQIVYLVATDYKNDTFIFDVLEDGIACKFSMLDIDNDGKTELLVTYSYGANGNALKIYGIDESESLRYRYKSIKKWEDTNICSHYFGRSGIIVEQGKIETINRNMDDYDKVDINTYKVENKKVILIKTITE